MAVLVSCGLFCLAVLGAAWLGWRARDAERRFAVLTALFLGPNEVPEARTDLRFATVAWALGIVTLGFLLLPFGSGTGVGGVAFALLGGVPTLAVLMGLMASGLRRLPRWKARAEEAREHEGLGELLERAREEVALARDRVEGPRREALLALQEALEEYASDLAGGAREGLEERLQGVIDMARSCLLEEARQAARELGVRPGASPAEVRAVYLALRRIYTGEEALPGVDAQRSERIELAYERLKLRFALEESSRALRAMRPASTKDTSSQSLRRAA